MPVISLYLTAIKAPGVLQVYVWSPTTNDTTPLTHLDWKHPLVYPAIYAYFGRVVIKQRDVKPMLPPILKDKPSERSDPTELYLQSPPKYSL